MIDFRILQVRVLKNSQCASHSLCSNCHRPPRAWARRGNSQLIHSAPQMRQSNGCYPFAQRKLAPPSSAAAPFKSGNGPAKAFPPALLMTTAPLSFNCNIRLCPYAITNRRFCQSGAAKKTRNPIVSPLKTCYAAENGRCHTAGRVHRLPAQNSINNHVDNEFAHYYSL